jgi:hypothetical protein
MKEFISTPSFPERAPWDNLSWAQILPLVLVADLTLASLAWVIVSLVMR